jgi:hypothetical protein
MHREVVRMYKEVKLIADNIYKILENQHCMPNHERTQKINTADIARVPDISIASLLTGRIP